MSRDRLDRGLWPEVTPDPTSGREPDWDDDYRPATPKPPAIGTELRNLRVSWTGVVVERPEGHGYIHESTVWVECPEFGEPDSPQSYMPDEFWKRWEVAP